MYCRNKKAKMESRKVALVTGSNKGIGFGIVRGLCKSFDGDVFLTSRSEELGRKAVARLEKEGLSPKFHQLDVTDNSSIYKCKRFFQTRYGGVDILVNNAGISIGNHSKEEGKLVINTNFTSILDMSNAFFPLLRSNARVVNVSSRLGNLVFRNTTDEFRLKFSNPDLTVDMLIDLVWELYDEFDSKDFNNDLFFGNYAYGVSKLGLTVLTTIYQRHLSAYSKNIIINACCPGYVVTDLTSNEGTLSIDEGAVTPLSLALLPPGTTSPAGEMIYKKHIITPRREKSKL